MGVPRQKFAGMNRTPRRLRGRQVTRLRFLGNVVASLKSGWTTRRPVHCFYVINLVGES